MLLCPQCDQPIPPADINIAQDVAMCRRCNAVVSVSAMVRGEAATTPAEPASISPAYVFDPAHPPPGAWYHDDGVEVRFGATTRTSNAALLVPFALVWSAGSLGGIFGTQIASGKFDPLLSLFGLVFLAASVALWSFALMSLCGRVEVRARQSTAHVFVGVGPIGWSKSLSTGAASTVREDWAGWSRHKRPQRSILIEGPQTLKFGSMLTPERRSFVLGALRRELRLD